MKTQSISRELARFIYGLSFRQLPDEVVGRAKNLILDALSALIAGHDSPFVKIGLELVKNNKGDAPVFTYNLAVPTINATFINAILTNSTGQDDWVPRYNTHAGAIAVPVTLTIADQEGSSGAEAITAVVASYDIMGRIFLGGPSMAPVFRGTSVTGPFGAAAAAGKLLKLNEDQLTNALGYAANFASGFAECFATGFMERKFNDAMASQNGVIAALLAKEGAKASETTLEGEAGFYQAFARTTAKQDAVVSDFGKRFFIMDATYKPYPASGTLQTPLDLALNLVKQHDIRGKDIDRVVLTEPEEASSFPGHNYTGPFTSRLPALASAQFVTAAALLGKPVASYAFYDNYNDPEVMELINKVKVIGEKGRDTIKIEVTLRDGKQYSIEGSGADMLTPTADRIRVKFASLASDFLGKEKAEKIINIVLNLDKVYNIHELTQELR